MAPKGEQQPRQHHIVPVCYLKRFCIPGGEKVAVLDLSNGDIRSQRPSKILRRRDHNRQPDAPDGIDEFVFEKALATVFEAKLPTMLDELQSQVPHLSDRELLLFMEFLEIQRPNVPKIAEVFRELAKVQVEEVARAAPGVAEAMQKYRLQVEIKETHRFNYMRELIGSRQFVKYLYRMVWYIREMPEGVPLVTTDAPVVIVNSADKPGAMHGIGLLGARLIYPLSPRFCLELNHPERIESPNGDYLQPVELAPIREDAIVLRRAAEPIPEEGAICLNRIMAREADRYVVSSDEEVLASIPTLVF